MKIVQSEMYDTFDELFDIVRENIDRDWRSFKVDDVHIAIIVYQRVLLECMNDDSLSAVKKLRQVKLWVVGFLSVR